MTICASHDNGNVLWLNTGRDWKEGGSRDDAQTIAPDQPGPTVTGKSGGQWQWRRPATTVVGDSRLWPPGHKVNADDIARLGEEEAHARYGDRAGSEALRLEVWQALVLQTFPPDYPLQGSRTEQFQQVGNAVPPLLARHLITEVLHQAVGL
jgi:DNA (cytosine-5)-methyltransferase 1